MYTTNFQLQPILIYFFPFLIYQFIIHLFIFSKMDRIEYRAVIKFLTLEGNAPMDIHQRLVNVYDDSAPSYAIWKISKFLISIAFEKFGSDEELIEAVNRFFDKQPKTFFHSGFETWIKRWKKCIDALGDYIEK